jgi:phosphopantothenoylcysteine decarboxylase/phosphopantothenate--cysteine ligase
MRIVLGVTGGVAAYKAAELVRLLQQRGASVQVVMTRGAQAFVRPLTFASLTGERVVTGMFGTESRDLPEADDSPGAGLRAASEPASDWESAIEHIAIAQSADALLVAPATAHTLARFALGLADDFLTTLYLATPAPVIVAPAMNVQMWAHPATRKNLQILRERGVTVVEPGEGYLACGMVGEGRLAELDAIVGATLGAIESRRRRDYDGETLMITAGPTREPVDAVRYLTNRSSGRMGYALAEAALARGARVVLISGPTALPAPAGCEFVPVETAAEMSEAAERAFPRCTCAILAAAVADVRPAHPADRKLHRSELPPAIALDPTPDILVRLAALRTSQFLVGFAAETNDAVENARRKLLSKRADLIVANDVSRRDIGFDSPWNAVWLVSAAEVVEVARAPKREIADRILDAARRLRSLRQTQPAMFT